MKFSHTALAIALLALLLSLGDPIAATHSYDGVASFQAFPCPIEGCNGQQNGGNGGRTPSSVCKDGYCSTFERMYGTCPEDCPPEEEEHPPEEEEQCPKEGDNPNQTELCTNNVGREFCCFDYRKEYCLDGRCELKPNSCGDNQYMCFTQFVIESQPKTRWCCDFTKDGYFQQCGADFGTCEESILYKAMPSQEDETVNLLDEHEELPKECTCENSALYILSGDLFRDPHGRIFAFNAPFKYTALKQKFGDCTFVLLADSPAVLSQRSSIANRFAGKFRRVMYEGHGTTEGAYWTDGSRLANLACEEGELELLSCEVGQPRWFGELPEIVQEACTNETIGLNIIASHSNIVTSALNPFCAVGTYIGFECTGDKQAKIYFDISNMEPVVATDDPKQKLQLAKDMLELFYEKMSDIIRGVIT